jgi:thiol-disulfide isomerase/thioredoxin
LWGRPDCAIAACRGISNLKQGDIKVAYSPAWDCVSLMSFKKLLLPFVLVSLVLTVGASAQGRSTKGEKPLSISQGQKVELADFLIKGRITIFDFTSEYCPPCRAYSDPLYQLHRRRNDLAVVKVDINRPEVHRIDWQSPVAEQYGLRAIPYFKIYGPDRKLITEGQEARRVVDDWIAALE